jgi:hypothetical protein
MEAFEDASSLITRLISSIRGRGPEASGDTPISVRQSLNLAEEMAVLQESYNHDRMTASELGFAFTCILFMVSCAILVYAAIYDASWATLPAFLLVGTYTLSYRSVERWSSRKLLQNREAIMNEITTIYPYLMVRNSSLH